jgi:hypothetical protein
MKHRCAMTRRDFVKLRIFTTQTALRENTQHYRFWGLKSSLRSRYVSKIFSDGQDNRAAVHDLGLASSNLQLEATARGLFVHQMIGILPDKARKLYDIPVHG